MTDELHKAGVELAQKYADLNDEIPRVLLYTRPEVINIGSNEEIVITIRRRHRAYIPKDRPLIMREAVSV